MQDEKIDNIVHDRPINWTNIKFGRRTIMAGTGGLFAATAAVAGTVPSKDNSFPWTPQFEPQDSWLDKPNTRHRFVFDTHNAKGAAAALQYVNNFYAINESAYGLRADTLGVVVIFRFMSTAFGFSNVIWKKYGHYFSEQLGLRRDMAIEATKANPLDNSSPNEPRNVELVTLSSLARIGTSFAVCGLATEGLAGLISQKTGESVTTVHRDLTSNLIMNAKIVPAGIVTLNRAQEHGYAFAYMG